MVGMARFFAVNWAVAVVWMVVAVAICGTAADYYRRIDRFKGVESIASAELDARGISGTHNSTQHSDDSARVLYDTERAGHFVEVHLSRGKNGTWHLKTINKDFVP